MSICLFYSPSEVEKKNSPRIYIKPNMFQTISLSTRDQLNL